MEEFGIRLRLDLGIADDQQTKLSMCGALKLLISSVEFKKKRSGHPGWDLGEKAKRMEFDLVFSFKCFQCILCLCFAYKSHCFMRH